MPVQKSTKRCYIVRSGPHNGQYITFRTRQSKDAVVPKKYAWTPVRAAAVKLTYEQARGVRRRYGGEVVCVA
jgi:hypothetical protein